MAYLSCANCGDLLYYYKEDFEKDETGKYIYFRDEINFKVVHHFCNCYCLGQWVTDNFKRKEKPTLNGGENTIETAMLHLSDLYNRIPR